MSYIAFSDRVMTLYRCLNMSAKQIAEQLGASIEDVLRAIRIGYCDPSDVKDYQDVVIQKGMI